jgi:hypothetical protein
MNVAIVALTRVVFSLKESFGGTVIFIFLDAPVPLPHK